MTDRGDNGVQETRVAKGAGAALLGRLGALIEAGSILVFAWAYGATTFGLFAALWSYVKVMTAVVDLAMPVVLQRIVPLYETRENGKAEAAAGLAIIASTCLAMATAIAVWIAAPALTPLLNAASDDAAHLVELIQIYIWVLPLWTLVEVATAAVRARRRFGPEIKIRIFYEQAARLIAALVFAGLGWLTFGLVLAHLVSVGLAALLSLRLVARHYDLRLITGGALDPAEVREVFGVGIALLPATCTKKLFSELPVMLLNALLPGAAGAAAGGYYSLARKIASVLQVVRLTFDYVMTPLAAERAGHGDREALNQMASFATRTALFLAVPLAAFLITSRDAILLSVPTEFAAASTAIAVLVIGRLLEAASGPASAILEALGQRFLPALNAVVGIAVLGVIAFWLVPDTGVTGAALAAAAGLNVTAWLAVVETHTVYQIKVFVRRQLFGLGLVTGLTVLLHSAIWVLATSPIQSLYIALPSLLLTLFIGVRFGLSDADAAALGGVARLVGRRNKKAGQDRRGQ